MISGRDIRDISLGGVVLIALFAAMLGYGMCGASGCAPYPEPVEPTPPSPVEPGPPLDPVEPAATSCARAAARYVELRCGTATAEQYEAACNGYEALGGAATWEPDCQAAAATCEAIEACRGGQ